MPPETAEYIVENEVTPETIRDIFSRAFYSTDLDDDGDVVVIAEPTSVLISINKDNRLLKYSTYYRVDETAPLNSKLAFVNKMNDDMVFCRFSIPEDHEDTLVADYFLPFGESISSFQIVSSLRLFALVVVSAIRDCDDDDLVK